MKKIYIHLLLIILPLTQNTAQTYTDDIAEIMFENCTGCHHNGGIAPFPLMDYTQVSAYGVSIQNAVNTGKMPPWPPSTTYTQFAHERKLTTAQITTINNWVNAGTPQGNIANMPPTPTYSNGPKLGTGDLVVKIPTYISKATAGHDDYVCFSIPSGLLSNQIIQAVEIIPGNPSIVHHALVYIDPAATYATDTTSHGCGGPTSTTMPLVGAYAPGGSPSQFPNSSILKMGVSMASGSNVVITMHYPTGSQGLADSTEVHLHFYPSGATGIRPVYAYALLYNYTFNIAANTVDSVQGWYPDVLTPLAFDFTAFSIFPHAHLLGKSFIVYAVNSFFPFNQIPLIHIPKWNIEWQDFYVFKYLKKIPAGYKLYGKCVYDNTTNNPYNPNTPPINVGYGPNTTDEMFFVTFQYIAYQFGDENINVDSLLQIQNSVGIEPLAVNDEGLFLTTYPNPSNDITTIHYYTQKTEKVSLSILDMSGKMVYQLIDNQIQNGEQFINWNGQNEARQIVPAGMYICQLKVGNKMTSTKIVRE